MHFLLKGIRFTLILCFTFISSCFSFSASDHLVAFDTSISSDATAAVLSEILNLDQQKINTLEFQKGIYHFYPDKALEKFCYISNHDDLMVRTAFPINNFKNLTIDGKGSTFIFHGIMIPFLIDESENIIIKNVSIDWAMPFHTETTIVANDEVNHTFDMTIPDDVAYEIRNEQLFFIKEYYQHTLGQTILYNPERKAIMFNTHKYTGLTYLKKNKLSRNLNKINYKYKVDPRSKLLKEQKKEQALRIEELKPGLVRVYNHKKKLPPLGMILASKGDQSINRVAPAIRITNTNGFQGKHVNIFHAGGMGVIAENSSDIILDDFNITPSQGRMVSTTADATHFVGCRGKIVLKNSIFENQLDDAMNVHGTYQEIVDVLSDHTIGVRMGHSQQQGFKIGKKGDRIGLARLSKSFFPYDQLTIKDVLYRNGRYQIITFKETLPDNIKIGDLIENLSAYPEVLVENCKIRNNRARGLLISNPKKTTIKNNFFSTEMEAILIPVESGYWYESGNTSNIMIANNMFQDCQHSGFNRGVIRFVTDDDNENIAFKNVVIKNNTFNHFDHLVLEIANTDGLSFTQNNIFNSNTFPILYPQNPVVKLKTSKNIIFKHNNYKGKATKILEKDNAMPDLKFY